jgi:hypothetical protein
MNDVRFRFARATRMAGSAHILKVHHDAAIEHFYIEVNEGPDLRDFGLTWIVLDPAKPPAVRLRMFDDTWAAFGEVPQLFEALSKAEGITPDAMEDLLLSLGAEEIAGSRKSGGA